MGHSSTRITKSVNLRGDIEAFFGLSTGSLAALVTGSLRYINKWAKWKPLRSSELDLPTDDARMAAGRANAQDVALNYGVRASGLGIINRLADITVPTFTYEAPTTISTTWRARALDFVHPTDGNTYGYRSDATFDFEGTPIWASGDNAIVRGYDYGINLELNYNPHSAEKRKEMLSIRDFLINNQIEYDPLTTYPCVLIKQNSAYYLHGLYKGSSSSVSTIGSAGQQSWHMSTVNLPSGLSDGSCTLSFILVSKQIILHSSPNLDIANWIVRPNGEEAAWEAWFCPIPGATGLSATVSQGAAASTLATFDNVLCTGTAQLGATQFNIGFRFSNAYSGAVTVDIRFSFTSWPSTVALESSTKTYSATYSSGVNDTLVYRVTGLFADFFVGTVRIGDSFGVSVEMTTTAGGNSQSAPIATKTFTVTSRL